MLPLLIASEAGKTVEVPSKNNSPAEKGKLDGKIVLYLSFPYISRDFLKGYTDKHSIDVRFGEMSPKTKTSPLGLRK